MDLRKGQLSKKLEGEVNKMISEIKKIKEEEEKNKKEDKKKKEGEYKKNKSEYVINRERTKFIIDLAKEKKSLEIVFKLLEVANEKDYGNEITFKELAIFALEKITPKDIERIQEQSMSDMEKVERTLNEFNLKNNTKLSLGEFLIKKLNIN